MNTVRLGKTDLMVSRVGMGGIPITRPQESDAIKTLQRAHDYGISFFDTATGYGLGTSDLCGDCEGRCPFSLPIRDMIKENMKFYGRVAKREL